MSPLGIPANGLTGHHGNSVTLCLCLASCEYGRQMKIWNLGQEDN